MIEFFSHMRFLLFLIFFIISGISAVILFYRLKKRNPEKTLYSWGMYAALSLLIILVSSFVATEWYIFNRISQPDELYTKSELDAIIILGSGVDNGKPGPLMETRLQASLPTLKHFNRNPIIVTGSITKNEPLAEAVVMKNYLIEHGIEKERIIVEDQALDTKDNLELSEKLLVFEGNAEPKVIIVTNNFHIARSEYLAHTYTNLNVKFLGTPAPKEHYLNYMIREYFAFVQDFLFEG